MSKLEYAERFVNDLALIESPELEKRILANLDTIALFGNFATANVPKSIKRDFGEGVRKVAASPFDLVYTFYSELDLVRIEALVHQRAAW